MNSEVSHYHITLDESMDAIHDLAKRLKAKVTTIDLIKGDIVKRDIMLTKYQKGKSLETLFSDVNALAHLGVEPIKAKLELMLNDIEQAYELDIKDGNYIELHVDTLYFGAVDHFGLSANAKDKNRIFYNARARTSKELEAIVESAKHNGISFDGAHIEYVLFDNNLEHDRWWL